MTLFTKRDIYKINKKTVLIRNNITSKALKIRRQIS